MVSAKNEIQSSLLAEKLNLRLADATYTAPVTKAYDTNGDVYLTVKVSASNDAIIKFAQAAVLASGAKDALGLDQRVYTPHIVSVLFDITAATGTTSAVKLAILGEVLRIGMRVDEYDVDAGAKGGNKYLELADIAVANFISSFESLEWGERASV